MLTVLFDIDGTLLDARGAGTRAMQRAAFRLFGCPEIPRVELAGRTDFAIFHDVLAGLGLSPVDWYPRFRRQYHAALSELLEADRAVPLEVLAGVVPLLRALRESEECRIGLLTGNSTPGATIKLRRAGLADFFSAGGFGDWTACRTEVARAAMEAMEATGWRCNPGATVVIGDSVHDVRCARACGLRVVAVATGGTARSRLAGESPDLLVDSLRAVGLAELAGLVPG